MNMPAKKINHNKILLIGNSKSWNSSEYMPKVLGDLGYLNTEVICPYKGGATLQNHYDNRNTAAYYERYICYTKNTYGWKEKTSVSLTQIIADNPDITHVIFQQNTQNAEIVSSYSCLNDLIGLFSGCNARPKFYLMSQWASANVTDSNTDNMLSVCKEVAESNSNIQDIIPVGHCIEKLKSNSLFTDVAPVLLADDNTHLHPGFPKTMAALSIVETLFGLDDKLYLSDGTNDATYLINNLCWNIAKETKAYNIVDESWHNLTYTEYFKNYNNVSSYQPKYKKVGNVVTIIGVVTPTGTLAQAQNGYRIAEGLPSDCCPPTTFRVVCAGSGMNKWLLNVNTTGTLGASRYGIDTDSDMTTGIWMPFSVTYLV